MSFSLNSIPPLFASLLFACSAYLLVVGCFSFIQFILQKVVKSLSELNYWTQAKAHWPDLSRGDQSIYDFYFAWSRLKFKVSFWLLGLIFILGFVSFIFSGNYILFVASVMGIAIYGLVVYKTAYANRQQTILQLPDALTALVQSLKAGFSITDAIEIVERETSDPLKQVFKSIRRANSYNMNTAHAAKVLASKLQLAEWDLFAETLYIQNKVGGNIIPVIEAVSQLLRDKVKAEQEVKTSTAAGKFSGIIIALLAPISFGVMYFLAPEYIQPLYQSDTGVVLLVLAGISETIGFVWIMKILRIDF